MRVQNVVHHTPTPYIGFHFCLCLRLVFVPSWMECDVIWEKAKNGGVISAISQNDFLIIQLTSEMNWMILMLHCWLISKHVAPFLTIDSGSYKAIFECNISITFKTDARAEYKYVVVSETLYHLELWRHLRNGDSMVVVISLSGQTKWKTSQTSFHFPCELNT